MEQAQQSSHYKRRRSITAVIAVALAVFFHQATTYRFERNVFMRLMIGFCSALLAVAIMFSAAGAQTTAGTLTGKMAPFSYLLGTTWSCTVSVPAMMGTPAHTDKSAVTFEPAPNNTMHVHISTSNLTEDQYFGYSSQQNMYWSSTASSMGAGMMQTSPDGKTYTGTMPMGGTPVTIRDTYTKVTDTHVTFTDTGTVNGKNYVTTGDCTR